MAEYRIYHNEPNDPQYQRSAYAAGQGYVIGERGFLVRKRGTNGRLACKWCGGDLTGRRTSYCSDECSHEYRLRAEPAYMRACVYERDRGVCANCGLDTVALQQGAPERKGYYRLPVDPAWYAIARSHGYSERFLKNIDREYPSMWAADHIVPVVEGGGGCGLDGMRTLCIPCHNKETAELAKRLGPKRREQNRRRKEDLERRKQAAKARRGELVQATLLSVSP